MKLGDANYDSTVEQKRTELRGHKVTQLTESECKQEIEAIVGGARSSFEGELPETIPKFYAQQEQEVAQLKKKRGRPPGSRNRPKGP